MGLSDKYGSWALIAGAAEGLGKSWSRSLARRGMNLVMIDHSEDTMSDLAELLAREYGIETRKVLMDLSHPEAASRIIAQLNSFDCRLMVYNAAYSLIRKFTEIKEDELDQFIAVNVRTQIKLVHAFSNYLLRKNTGGGIILMSSLAGLIGMQLVAPYAATKAFTWNLAEAISHELKPYNIDVMACIAGATSTPAYLKTDPQYSGIRPLVMSPDKVTEAALKKIGKKSLFIPGFKNRLNYFILTRLLPRRIAARLANKTMGNMYGSYK